MAVSKRTLNKLATALVSWERGLARLGECFAHFQRIDWALNICISALIGRSRRVGEIVTSEMSFRAKISIYSALCHHSLSVDKLPEELRELVSRLHWAEQERNTIAHSLWDASEKLPDTIRRQKMSSKKGRFVATAEHLTSDDLEELGRLFEGVAADLFYLTSEHIPKLKDKFNKY